MSVKKSIKTLEKSSVFTIFVVANHLSSDFTVQEAFNQKKVDVNVRDSGRIVKVYPVVATDTVSCRIESMDKKEFDFIFTIVGSYTVRFELGKSIQFYGQYKYDEKGGTVTSPYKTKQGRMDGWVSYNNQRYIGDLNETDNTNAQPAF